MLVALVPSNDGFRARALDEGGHPAGPDRALTATEVAAWEAAEAPRWVFDSAARIHRTLLDAGITVRRATTCG